MKLIVEIPLEINDIQKAYTGPFLSDTLQNGQLTISISYNNDERVIHTSEIVADHYKVTLET